MLVFLQNMTRLSLDKSVCYILQNKSNSIHVLVNPRAGINGLECQALHCSNEKKAWKFFGDDIVLLAVTNE